MTDSNDALPEGIEYASVDRTKIGPIALGERYNSEGPKDATDDDRRRHIQLRNKFRSLAMHLDHMLPAGDNKDEVFELLDMTSKQAHKALNKAIKKEKGD